MKYKKILFFYISFCKHSITLSDKNKKAGDEPALFMKQIKRRNRLFQADNQLFSCERLLD